MIDNQSKCLKFVKNKAYVEFEKYYYGIGVDNIKCCNNELCKIWKENTYLYGIQNQKKIGYKDKLATYTQKKLLVWRREDSIYTAYTIHDNLTYEIVAISYDKCLLKIWTRYCYDNYIDKSKHKIYTGGLEEIKLIAQKHFNNSLKQYCLRKNIDIETIELNVSDNVHYLINFGS